MGLDVKMGGPSPPRRVRLDRGFGDFVAFTGGQEEVGLEAVLSGVEIVVAAAQGKQLGVVAALQDSSMLHDQDLIGAADGGEAMGNDERRAALHQLAQA